MGFGLLLALSTLAGLAALAWAVRGWGAGVQADVDETGATRVRGAREPREGTRAEILVATTVLWMGFVVTPVLALGWAEQLTPTNLAMLSAGLSSALLAGALIGPGAPARAAGVIRAAGRLLALPIVALREAWWERSPALVALIGAYAVFLWTAWLTWLAPSSGWDSLWYHDTIVGFALQNQGFALVDVPPNLEFVNGYPKTSEALSLWLVAFADRRLIEAANHLTAPLLMAGYFLLARRYTEWRVGAMGFAAVLFLLPAIALQLRSTYVDGIFAATFIAALHFVTRPVLRARDVVLAGLALGLLGGMKGTGLVVVPTYLGILALRVGVQLWRDRRPAPALAWAGALVAVGLLAAPFYLRNWIVHDNPAWPVPIQYEKLDIDWPGHWVVSGQWSPKRVWEEVISAPPVPDGEFHDTRRNGYGNGPPFIVGPLALVGLLGALGVFLRSLFSRGPPLREAGNLLLVTLPALFLVYEFSPAYWWARFNLHGVVALFLLATWALGGLRWRTFGQGVVGALAATSLLTLFWSEPGWGVSAEKAIELAGKGPSERAAFIPAAFFMGEEKTMRARDRELGRGDVVAFTEDFGFPGLLWNERFSNRLVYVPYEGGRRGFLRALGEVEAEWVSVKTGSRHERALLSRPELWVPVGRVTDVNLAYRRTSMPLDAPEEADGRGRGGAGENSPGAAASPRETADGGAPPDASGSAEGASTDTP